MSPQRCRGYLARDLLDTQRDIEVVSGADVRSRTFPTVEYGKPLMRSGVDSRCEIGD